MKFIYKLDCVMPSVCASGDGVDMDYDDLMSSMDMDIDGPGMGSFVERTRLMEGLMMQLSTCPTYQHDAAGSASGVLKTVDTDEVASANGHYTLEDFFSGYGEVNRNESIDDVSETDLDFSKLFGNFDDAKEENPFQSLIDLVKCEIPEDLSVVDDRFPKEVKMEETPVVLTPQISECKLVPKPEVVQAKNKKNLKTNKKPKTPAPKPDTIVGTRLVEKKEYVNSRKIDYGANDTPDNIYDLQWHPGFTRHLGAKGRSALLELVRKVYRQDPEHYKAILQAKNSSSSISNLPFYSIPMLWELAHQFGIFKQALTVYKTHCFSKSRSNRFYGFGKSSQTSVSSDSSDIQEDSQKQEKRESPEKVESPKLPLTTMSGRLVKRSKKILEYNPDSPLDNLDLYVNLNSKSQSSQNDHLDQSLSQLSLNGKDELSNSQIGSPNRVPTGSKSSQNDSHTPLMWKLAVANRSSNYVGQFKDETMTSGHKLNRRISV